MRRKTTTLAMLLLSALLVAAVAVPGCTPKQDEYPSKAITLVCPWGAGGGTDRIARYLADKLSVELGQPVAVINQTGGNGAVGHNAGALAAADGYTICITTWEMSILRHMGWSEIAYDNIRGVALINKDAAGLLVNPADAAANGWKDATDWIDYVKQNPGVQASGTGTGGVWHVALLGMLAEAGVSADSVEWLPSTGAAEGITWLLGDHIDAVTCSLVEAAPQIEAGTLTALATMSADPFPLFPDIPTLKSVGIDWELGAWRGITVPKDTPDEIVDVLHTAIKTIVDSQDWKDWMVDQGFGQLYLNSAGFDTFMADDYAASERLLKAGGLID
jgi:tripartite-type tricarboxylate transporter receptor subunit TctC